MDCAGRSQTGDEWCTQRPKYSNPSPTNQETAAIVMKPAPLEVKQTCPASNVERRCTDTPWLVAWILCWMCLIPPFCVGFENIDTPRFRHIPNSNSEWCGYTKAVKDKPFMAYCWSEGTAGTVSPHSSVPYTRTRECVTGCSSTLSMSNGCLSYPSKPSVNAFCAATVSTIDGKVQVRYLGKHQFILFIVRIAYALDNIKLLAASTLLAFLLSLLFLQTFMKHVATMFRCSLLLAIVLPIPIGLLFLYTPTVLKEQVVTYSDPLMDMLAGYSCFILSITILFMYCCNLRQVKMAIKCIDQACDCIEEVPTLLGKTVLLMFLRMIMASVWSIGLLHLLTRLEEKINWKEKAMVVFYCWMGLWHLSFSMGLAYFSTTYAAQRWFAEQPFAVDYYDRPRKSQDELKAELRWVPLRGAWIALRYHTGTLAYGAALIIVFSVPRIILDIIVSLAKKVPFMWGEEIHEMLWCCFCCYDDYLKRISWKALFAVCSEGTGFGASSILAVQKLKHEAVAHELMGSATWLLLIGGVSTIALICIFFTYSLMMLGNFNVGVVDAHIEDSDPAMVCYVAAAMAIVVSIPCTSLFKQVADTILFCFVLDESTDGILHRLNPKVLLRNLSGSVQHHSMRFKEHLETSIGCKARTAALLSVAFQTQRTLHAGYHSEQSTDSE